MTWNGHSVMITGAGGFIGSHLVETLVEQGADVRAFVHYNSRNDPGLLSLLPREIFHEIEIKFGDLRDPLSVRKAIEHRATIFHLGAIISIPYSYANPYEVAETNLLGTLNVLQACRESEVERLIHTSSSEVYGSGVELPITESHRLKGQSPYSASKIGADKLAESYFCAYSLPVVTLRPFNTFGPRQSARAIIPTIITQALVGDVIHLGNITPRRDLTYVTDLVDGFLKLAQAPGVEGETFNIGTGADSTIAELVDQINRLLNKNVKIVTDEERKRPERSEVQRLQADSSRAREQLGWEPKISLEDGLRRTISWISDNMNSYELQSYKI